MGELIFLSRCSQKMRIVFGWFREFRILFASPSPYLSSFTVFMKQFLETIRILDSVPQHIDWHQRRVDATLRYFYPVHHHSWDLASCIDVPLEFQSGVVQCRIIYDAHLFSIHYFHYPPGSIKSLKLVEAPPGIDYRYKYADRKILEDLYMQRGNADDILITKDGWITDTSIANISFQSHGRWYTPSIPLLAGTTWKRLVSSGILITCPVHSTQLKKFEVFNLFNAMNNWEEANGIPIQNIG